MADLQFVYLCLECYLTIMDGLYPGKPPAVLPDLVDYVMFDGPRIVVPIKLPEGTRVLDDGRATLVGEG